MKEVIPTLILTKTHFIKEKQQHFIEHITESYIFWLSNIEKVLQYIILQCIQFANIY